MAWPATATPPSTLIIIEDELPYFIPVTATVASGNPIRWGNPTPTHHTVTHNGCPDNSGPCTFDSGTMPPGDTCTLPGLPPGRHIYSAASIPSCEAY